MTKDIYESPLGTIELILEDNKLISLDLTDGYQKDQLTITDASIKVKNWLDIYFNGNNPNFMPDINLKGTDFQISVWKALMDIPYGELVCYQDIAIAINRPTATRAVAKAISKNPIPLIIPCHRVIKADGNISGYSKGIDKKLFLIALES